MHVNIVVLHKYVGAMWGKVYVGDGVTMQQFRDGVGLG